MACPSQAHRISIASPSHLHRTLVPFAEERSHRVTVFNRGRRQADLPPGVEELVGDRNTGEPDALRGREWDVVIDNPTTLPFWVRDVGEILQGTTGQYIFISTLSSYDTRERPPPTRRIFWIRSGVPQHLIIRYRWGRTDFRNACPLCLTMSGRSPIRLPRRLLLSALGVSLAFVAGCEPAPPAGGAAGEEEASSGLGDGGLRIAVSLPPLAWAAAALAPEGSSVTLLLDAGASPHGATLTASRARALAEADLVLLVGWNFEPAMERILVADRRPRQVLRLSEVMAERGLTPPPLHLPEGASGAPDSPEPDHGQEPGVEHVQDHGHGHGPDDPHAWLDPLAMEAWVEALGERLGAPRETIDSLRAITSEVDARYREGLGPLTQRALVSHHDGLGWLARRYDLEVLAVLRPEGLVETRPSDVRRATEAIQERGLGALFIEPQFGDRAALRIRDLTGVELVTLDPIGTDDWPATMRTNLEQLRRGLSAPPAGARPLAASPEAASPSTVGGRSR